GEPPAAKPTDSPTTGEPEPPPSPAPPPPREEPPAKPEEAPKPAKAPRPVAPSTIRSPTTPADGASPVTRGSADHARLRALLAVDARRNLEVTSYCYGGKVGLDYAGFRFLLEGCGAVVSVSRGTITSGIGDVRVGRAQPIVVLGGVQLGVDLSVAGGANWAVGNSSVVNTHLRRVLMPYADARVGLFAASRARTAFTPLIEVYAGRAVGIVSNADGEAVSATGGWFSGVELGLWL
ncbi:MAG TPA: hypothetical protein VFQ35_13445, partial [Polyangiaceae bacterium]|nr:hypothetical protein [Polyangiaceae bacterium]